MSISRIGRAVIAAALIVGASAAIKWLQPHYLSGDTARRILGEVLGAVVVVYANAIPKVLAARPWRGVSVGADQAMRRFAGWSMVIGGLGYMLAWLFLPVDSAGTAGGALLGAALLVAIVRCLRVVPGNVGN